MTAIPIVAATRIRVKLADGTSADYPLVGPRLPRVVGRRIFMLELPRSQAAHLILLKQNLILAKEDLVRLPPLTTAG